MIVTLFGKNDDQFVLKGCPGEGTFKCSDPTPYQGYVDLVSRYGRLRVHVIYDGRWSFAFGQIEDKDRNDWFIGTSWYEYSAYHTIVVPNDTRCYPCEEFMNEGKN